MVAFKKTVKGIVKEPVFLLPPDIDLVIQSGSMTAEDERLVSAFIKKSKANRRRRQRYAEKKALHSIHLLDQLLLWRLK